MNRNTMRNWLKTAFASKGRLYIFGVISLVIAVSTLFLAVKLSPWLYAMNVRVTLHLQAPAETKISVCWDKLQVQCLPLVPYQSAEKRIPKSGENADTWLSELPVRSTYFLSLTFKSDVANGIFQDLELNSLPGILWGNIPGMGVQDTRLGIDQFNTKKIVPKMEGNLYYFTGTANSQLIAINEVKPGTLPNSNNQQTTLILWGLLFSIYLFFAIPLFILPFTIQNIVNTPQNIRLPRYPWSIYGIGGLAIALMLLLIVNSPVSFDQYDPKFYLQYATSKNWFNPSRPPGYQLFLMLIFGLSQYSLNAVAFAQGMLFAASTTICIWVLRKWLHPAVSVGAFLLILFSPIQIHWALSIMRESLFVSLILLGITAAIAHFTTSNKFAANVWLVIFTLICALALFVRENGILMPVVLLPGLFLEGVKRLKSSDAIQQRIRNVFSLLIRYTIPVLGTAVVYIALCTNNYLTSGYFQFTLHATSHHLFWREITTSSFDSRSLLQADPSMSKEAKTFLGSQLFRSFMVTRHENPILDPIIVSLFPTLNEEQAARGQPVTIASWFFSASIIEEIGKKANTLTPWQANLIGILRQYNELLVSTPSSSGGYTPMLDDPTDLDEKQKVLGLLEKNVHYDGKQIEPHSLIDIYYVITRGYSWYPVLFILAILFSLYVLRFDNPVFLTPILLFASNAFLLLMLRGVSSRFIECFDVLLILQVALGLSRWIFNHLTSGQKKSNASNLLAHQG